METLIIEILDRFGKMKERHKVTSFPCNIGRDYTNDIIIDDMYISPRHVTLDKNDTPDTPYILNDNNSDNGVFSLYPFTKQSSIGIKDNLRVRIGHTDIRFRFPGHAVKNTIQERDKPSQISMLITSSFLLPLVWLIFGAVFSLNNYIETTELATTQKMLSNLFPLLIFMATWAMAWSVVSKIVTHRYYFSFHAMWVSALTLLSILADNMANYIEFSFSLSGASNLLSFIFSIAVTSLLLFGHLHYSTTLTAAKSKRIAIISSFIILGLTELAGLLHAPDFSNTPTYSGIIRPTRFIFSRQLSVDEFLKNTNDLKLDIDKKATKSD